MALNIWPFRRKQEKPARRRAYAGAEFGRLTSDWQAAGTSEDAELQGSLSRLRDRSRSLVRDNPHARRARAIFQNNVVGGGIGLQSLVVTRSGKLATAVNDEIEREWRKWCRSETCHTGGVLSFTDICRMAVGELFDAGEVLIRTIYRPFGGGKIPYALEVIEADRLITDAQSHILPNGHRCRMGVETDEWLRPVAYWLYREHPGDLQFTGYDPNKYLRIPADEIYHLYIPERWPQTRGVPWMHSVIRKLRDIGAYEEAEIVAARASAATVGFIRRPEGDVPIPEEERRPTDSTIPVEPGTFRVLQEGEDFVGFNPSRPNQGAEPFIRLMLREVATGAGVSYESLTKDYSNSNYSSSRLSILDDRQNWKVLQNWLVRNFVEPVYREWLGHAVLAGVLKLPGYERDPDRYAEARFKCPGWSWIDPTKEVEAYKAAVRSGFMTLSDVISQTNTGTDFEDTVKARKNELDMLASLGVQTDTTVEEPPPEPEATEQPPEEPAE